MRAKFRPEVNVRYPVHLQLGADPFLIEVGVVSAEGSRADVGDGLYSMAFQKIQERVVTVC